jgi:hypothetical protein
MKNTAKSMLMFLIALGLLLPSTSFSKEMACSIRAVKNLSEHQLHSLAKISRDAAERAAIDAAGKQNVSSVQDGELEVEHGCLIYSFDLRLKSRSGIDEVMIDAGSGAVLSRTHETPADEAREKAEDLKAIEQQRK